MSFTPKFVDLVRNFTTVQGTGPVVLGAAVSGYTSLAQALTTGDQFYYCLQSVDKPQEREVGRGTLQADGKIARDPVSGGPTDFSNGTKTIALVAAAEWFDKLEAGGAGGAAIDAASVAAIAARPTPGSSPLLLAQAGREGMFVFDVSDLSAKVTADTAQGIYVAPASDATGASGAWVRQFGGGPVNPAWFGLAEANTGSANSAAINAMLATLKARAVNAIANYQGLEGISFPVGGFDLDETIVLTEGSTIVEGTSMGFPAGHGTRLNFPAGVTGIRVHTYNNSGATGPADSPTHKGGQSIIRNLALFGAYTTAEAEAHGIHLRGQARIENVIIDLFEGDGIHADAGIGSGTIEGNANLSSIVLSRIQRCRNGIYFQSADSNACTIIGADCSSNRQWGVYDSSFLGNTYLSCHTASNGLSSGGSPPTMVTDGTYRYGVIAGQEAGASTNAPSGTTDNNTWWYYHSTGGVHPNWPTWVSGTTYRAGGAYRSDGVNARNCFFGCYYETDQGKAQLDVPAMVFGGMLAGANFGTAPEIQAPALNSMVRSVGFEATTVTPTGIISSRLGEKAADTILQAYHTVAAAAVWRLKFDSANNIRMDYAGGGTSIAFHITGNATTSQFGTGAAVSYAFHPVKLMVGDSLANARLISNGTAAPASGAHAQGEVVINRSASATGTLMWVCTVAGTPGTWVAVPTDSLSKQGGTLTGDLIVPDEAYDATGWNGDLSVPTKNALRDKIESLAAGGADPWDRTYLAVDYNNDTSTQATITDGTDSFAYTPPADSFYTIEADILILSTDAANWPLIGVYCPAGANVGYGAATVSTTGATETGAPQQASDGWNNPGADVAAQVGTGTLPAANVPFPVRVLVKGRSGSAPTEITIKMRCETNAVDTCYVKAGSEMRTRSVAA